MSEDLNLSCKSVQHRLATQWGYVKAEEVAVEPVAWMYVNTDGECEQIEYGEPFDDPSVTPLYTAPPKKEWVGLTDEDMEDLFLSEDGVCFARYIEAKLKEKNGG